MLLHLGRHRPVGVTDEIIQAGAYALVEAFPNCENTSATTGPSAVWVYGGTAPHLCRKQRTIRLRKIWSRAHVDQERSRLAQDGGFPAQLRQMDRQEPIIRRGTHRIGVAGIISMVPARPFAVCAIRRENHQYQPSSHRGSAPGHQGSNILIELGIEGYLRREDALKLYELAFSTSGDVLEAGTNKGLSTSIIAQALHDRGTGAIETIELDPANSNDAKANVQGKPGFERVTFTASDATKRMTELAGEGRKYGFIFIDHWHGYQATFEAAELVKRLLSPGGYVMFHDFLDPGNANRRHVYGVYQAVLDTIVDDKRFEFAGTSGCCAIFRFNG